MNERVDAASAHGPRWARAVGIVAPVAVALAVLGAGAAAVDLEHDRHDEEVQGRFALVDDDVQDQVQSLVDSQVAAAHASAAALAIDPDMGPDAFRSFADGLRAHYATLLGVGYVRRVPADELATFVADARRRIDPAFPAPEPSARDELAVILYNEPAAALRSSWGVDLLEIPEAAAALGRAVTTRQPAVTARTVLAVDRDRPRAEQPHAYVVYAPVLDAAGEVVGWANLPFRAQDLLDLVRVPNGVDVALEDADGTVVATSGPGDGALLETALPVLALDRAWTLRVTATPAFAAAVADRRLPALLLTLVVGGLLALLVALLARGNRRWTRAAERATASLAASEARLRATIAGAPDVILVVGGDGRIESASERARELVGVDPADLLGRHASALVEGWPAPGQPSSDDASIGRPDGRDVPVEVTVRPLPPAGEGRVVAIVRDLTERRRDEAAQALLSSIVRSTDDAVVTTSPAGVVTSWNRGAERLYGWTDREAVGHTFEALVDGVDGAGVVVEHDAPRGRAATHRRADGSTVEVSVTATPLPAGRGRPGGTSLIIRDVSAEARSRAALTAYAEELERSNRDLEEFAAIASHDLSEPLRVVGGYAGLIAHRYTLGQPLDAAGVEYLGAIERGVERMRQLIEGLLELARLRSDGTRVGPVALEDVVETAVDNLTVSMADTGASIDVGPLPTVWGDRSQLVQLLQNLLANAIRFHEPGHTPHVAVTAEPDGAGRWTIAVADDGIGIAPEHQDAIFGLFRRLHPNDRYPGTGIGLAVCRRVVELHGGELRVSSSPGSGATFRFSLEGVHDDDPVARPNLEVVLG